MEKNAALAWDAPHGIYSMPKPIFKSLMRFLLASPRWQYHSIVAAPVPDGIRLVYQPAYTPELQPAEHLWPLANKHFEPIDDLDAVVALRCRDLNFDRSLIAQHTGFHWWPKSAPPN
jgi:hypothetical protein